MRKYILSILSLALVVAFFPRDGHARNMALQSQRSGFAQLNQGGLNGGIGPGIGMNPYAFGPGAAVGMNNGFGYPEPIGNGGFMPAIGQGIQPVDGNNAGVGPYGNSVLKGLSITQAVVVVVVGALLQQ